MFGFYCSFGQVQKAAAKTFQCVLEPDNCEHQISLNHMDNKPKDEDAVITVNPAKNFIFY